MNHLIKYNYFLRENLNRDDDYEYEEEEDLDWSFVPYPSKRLIDFIEFLRKNGAEMYYLENLDDSKNGSGFIKIWNNKTDFLCKEDEYWISNAFSWADSPQGRAYWEKLDHEWQKW
jgi:hypothetical protein